MGIGEGRRSAHTGDETAVFGNMHVCMEHGHGDVGTASNNFSCDRFGARSPDDRELRDSASDGSLITLIISRERGNDLT